MLKRSLTEPLTRRATSRARSPRQYLIACGPTNQVRFAETLLAQRTPHLALAPANEAPVARTAPPSLDGLPTPRGWAAYPPTGLLTLLATEPEPDKLPAYLMREVAEQLGADGAYLFRTAAATQTLALAAWVIVDGAIQHRDTMPALMPLTHAAAIAPPAAPQVQRYLWNTKLPPEWSRLDPRHPGHVCAGNMFARDHDPGCIHVGHGRACGYLDTLALQLRLGFAGQMLGEGPEEP